MDHVAKRAARTTMVGSDLLQFVIHDCIHDSYFTMIATHNHEFTIYDSRFVIRQKDSMPGSVAARAVL